MTELVSLDTDDEIERIEKNRAILMVRISKWMNQHSIFVAPIIEQILGEKLGEVDIPIACDVDESNAEEVEILLPSSYPQAVKEHSLFAPFLDAEIRLREGQANDLLRRIREKLTLQAFMKTKTKDSTGQVAKTRNAETLQRTNNTIALLREEYNAVYKAMAKLKSIDTDRYMELRISDTVPLTIYHMELNTKKDDLPWIWRKTHGSMLSEGKMNDWTKESELSIFSKSRKVT